MENKEYFLLITDHGYEIYIIIEDQEKEITDVSFEEVLKVEL